MEVGIVIVPGCAGVAIGVTASVRGVPVPHALLAVTVMAPEAAVGIAVSDGVVEVPVHPVGGVHM